MAKFPAAWDMGPGMSMPTSSASQPQSLEQELQALKSQSQVMAQQLAEIQHRIEGLEKKDKGDV